KLRERVHNALAGTVADMPLVTTLHSYALRNLLHNSECLETLPRPLRIADDWEERNIVQEDLKGILGCKVADVRDKLNDLSADWDTLAADGWPDHRRADPAFVGAWQEHRRILGYTLRAELVYQLKHALNERGDFELVPATKHLLVDEYQDLNRCDLSVITAVLYHGAEV